MVLYAENLGYREINEAIRASEGDVTVTGCRGNRFIGAGMTAKNITIEGVPGNALGAYLNGGSITVKGNAQDALGDTMNEGRIVIHGSVGDAAGYAMRGGEIYVEKNAGYRAGIHMKAYREKIPALIIGGTAGSFLGEYQAGGTIIVLGLWDTERRIVGNFPCTGMHGGKMILRSDCADVKFPKQVSARASTAEDMAEIKKYISEFCRLFVINEDVVLNAPFTIVTPDSKNPYKQLYVAN